MKKLFKDCECHKDVLTPENTTEDSGKVQEDVAEEVETEEASDDATKKA